MTIAIGTGPAINSGNGTTVVSASFTRPAAGALLVATVMAVSDTAPVVTDSAGLTWTRRKQQGTGAYAEIWTAPVTGSGSMTVTSTVSGTFKASGLKVDAVTGHNAASPAGNSGGGTSASNAITPTGYTSSAAGSRGFFAGLESNGLGNPTSTDTGSAWTVSGFPSDTSGIAVQKAANTATAGEAVTFNADAAGTGAADWVWAALEIKPSSVDASIVTTTLAVVTAMPVPAVSTGASSTPATVTATTAMPAPAISAGAGVVPATVAATVAMPAPSVTTQNATLVELATVAAAVAMPSPAVSAGASLVPATVAATVAMPSPSVQVHADVNLSTIAVAVAMPSPVVSVPPLAGDRITRAGQLEWNGFLLGSGTAYSWQDLQGWRDSPPIISGNVDQPTGPGSYPGQPVPGERVINYGMLTKAARSQIAQVLRDLQMATGIAQTEDEGSLVVWDLDDAEPYLVYGHLTNRAPGPLNRQARLGLLRGALQWTCSDPAIYSKIRHSVPIPINVETDVLNDGNEASPRTVFRIPGPCTVPQIENMTLDRVFAFDVAILAGEILEIDVKLGNVLIGNVDKLNSLVEGSTSVKDMVLGPGGNRLVWSAETGGTLMDVLWRHAST